MKIVHVSADESNGGAARAANRVHRRLRHLGYDSTLFVARRSSDDPSVVAYQHSYGLIDKVVRRIREERIGRSIQHYDLTRQGYEMFSDDRTVYLNNLPGQLPPHDIVHLQWVSRFVDYRQFFGQISLRTPLFWTLRDMNPFTGGCHYDAGCGRFAEQCGSCPRLDSTTEHDLSRQIWQRKQQALARLPSEQLHLIGISNWVAEQARRSSLLSRFEIKVIPNGIDTDDFAPRNQCYARETFGIPQDARVLLFVAQDITNPRKGMAELIQTLRGLDTIDNLWLVSLGKGKLPEHIGLPHMSLGHISHDRILSIIYSAADLFVITSLQDVFPNTVLEAMACGTPVVGFAAGGATDIVRQDETGILTPTGDIPALQQVIDQLMNDPDRRAAMAEACRRVVLRDFTLDIQARRYAAYYEAVLQAGGVSVTQAVPELT
jgi:glycosyltransferase involved in cell wall biosynthesis